MTAALARRRGWAPAARLALAFGAMLSVGPGAVAGGGVPAGSLQSQVSPELSEAHRRWLEDDVAHIITEPERELFNELAAASERDAFIEAFWGHRDPDRSTPDNEYRDEHYRRLEIADRRFADGGRLGRRTERGRIFVLLGPPDQFQSFIASNEVVASELWFYQGNTALGLPPRFNVLFFQENNVGDYRIYSPLDDGPEALINMLTTPQERSDAMYVIQGVSTALARAALTIDLTDPVADFMAPPSPTAGERERSILLRPSTSANHVLASIGELPARLVDTDYVDGYRRFGDRVESDFSFRFVSNQSYWTTLFVDRTTPFLHVAVELDADRLGFRPSAGSDRLELRMRVDVEIESRTFGAVTIPAREVRIELDEGQLEAVRTGALSYQDAFPLVPGAYRVALTLRDVASGYFTIADRNVSIPSPAARGPAIGGIALGYRAEPRGDGFEFGAGELRVSPASGAVFTTGETMHALMQLFDAGGLELRMRVSGPGGVVGEESAAPTGKVFVFERPLGDLAPGGYTLQVDLIAADGAPLETRHASFDVVEQRTHPRTSIAYRNLARPPDLVGTAAALSELYLKGRDVVSAEQQLRRAMELTTPPPDSLRWQLASLVLFSGKADEALELLEPIEEAYPQRIEVVEGLAFARYLRREYGAALEKLELAMALRPPDTSILNAAADCYQQLGRIDKARELFELSLATDPSQEGVRARLLSLAAPQGDA